MKLGNRPCVFLHGKVLNPAKRFVLKDKRGHTFIIELCLSSFRREAF